MFLVRRFTPPLVALYGASFGSPTIPATDDTCTMDPPRPAFTISTSAKRETRNTPVRSIRSIRSQSSSETVVTDALRTMIPALLTRTSMPPSVVTASATMRSASAAEPTSPCTKPARPARAPDRLLQLSPPPAGDHDRRALAHEQLCGRAPDARPAARDQRALAREPHAVGPSRGRRVASYADLLCSLLGGRAREYHGPDDARRSAAQDPTLDARRVQAARRAGRVPRGRAPRAARRPARRARAPGQPSRH